MKKYWHVVVLVIIILVAFFIRAYNFHDWLYFEADQARNAKNSVEAIEGGMGNLPLLGPKAGGTNFHLGPVSYYFEYISGIFFGIKSPEVFAYSNLFFLLISIPLLFYFLRMFFSKGLSLLVVAVFSSSYIATQYSRFSWNPNSIIFWSILFAIAIYKSSLEIDKKRAGIWLIVASVSYSISSQLHTLPLIGFPLIALLFWVFYQPVKINWKYWLGAILIFIAFYSPLIIYDINTKGSNTKEFIKAFGVKSEKRNFSEKIAKTVEQNGKYYSLLVFSVNDKEFKNARFLGYLVIISSILAIIFLLKKSYQNKKENISLPRSFIILVSIWFLVFLLLDYLLAFNIDQPRFWFSSFFIPYVFLAILSYLVWNKKTGMFFVMMLGIVIISYNLSAILNWYVGMIRQDEINRFGRKITSTSLIQSDFIGLGNMEKAVEWIIKDSREDKKNICFNSPSTYLASYKFIFDRKYPEFDVKRINKTIEMEMADNCNIFIIDHGGNPEDEIVDKFDKKGVSIKMEKGAQFGLINIWKVFVGS